MICSPLLTDHKNKLPSDYCSAYLQEMDERELQSDLLRIFLMWTSKYDCYCHYSQHCSKDFFKMFEEALQGSALGFQAVIIKLRIDLVVFSNLATTFWKNNKYLIEEVEIEWDMLRYF